MSDRDVIAALQRQAAEAEVERLRLVGEVEAMRERAESAEARIASVSGVTREELVAAERSKRDGLLSALKALVDEEMPALRRGAVGRRWEAARTAIAKAEQT